MATTDQAQFDPHSIRDRTGLIRHLVLTWGMSRAKVAGIFRMSDRQVRRLTTASAMEALACPPPQALTKAEWSEMANDLRIDPYLSAEEREEALAFVARNAV